MLKLCLFGWFALIAVPAVASVEVIPPFPTGGQHVELRIVLDNIHGHDLTVTGNHFRIDLGECEMTCVPPPGKVDVNLSHLPPGNYTYEIFPPDGSPAISGGFVVAPGLSAQVIPPHPTTLDEVTLRVTAAVDSATVTREGNQFRVALNGCPFLCNSPTDISLGTLPAGEYSYWVFFAETPDDPVAFGPFVVALAGLADAPTLSPAALIALSLILVAAGWIYLGRQT